ncbi:MAG: SIS domain-containing protein [Rhizobiaceae bacterium]
MRHPGRHRQQVGQLSEPESLTALVEAARRPRRARRIYCLGLRSSHSPAWHLHYILSLAGKTFGHAGRRRRHGADALGSATADDVMVAISVLPYTRQTIEIADYAGETGVLPVAITDSPVAPLAQLRRLHRRRAHGEPAARIMSPRLRRRRSAGRWSRDRPRTMAGAALASVDRRPPPSIPISRRG